MNHFIGFEGCPLIGMYKKCFKFSKWQKSLQCLFVQKSINYPTTTSNQTVPGEIYWLLCQDFRTRSKSQRKRTCENAVTAFNKMTSQMTSLNLWESSDFLWIEAAQNKSLPVSLSYFSFEIFVWILNCQVLQIKQYYTSSFKFTTNFSAGR